MSRNRRVGIVVGVALLILAAQFVNTYQVRKELCSRISGAGDCAARTGLTSLQFLRPLITLQTENGEPAPLLVATALVRKTCEDGWTIGMGGRGETQKVALSRDTEALTAGRICVDMGMTRISGRVTDARVLINRCAIRLSPVQFSADGALQASVTATVDPSTIEACQQLLPQSAAALSGSIATAKVTLNARYEPEIGRSTGASSASAADDHQSGFARRFVSTRRTSHVLDAVLGDGHASLRLDTEPEGQSATVTLSVQADAAMAANLPDVPAPAGGPLKLDVRWNLDHQTGTVRVNGKDITRVPRATSRASGRVELPPAECNAAGRSLFFVEADDRGQPLQPQQLDGVFTAVDGAVAKAGALVVVFVHGWHHSAAPGDAYVCRLSDVLASVEQMEKGAATLAGRPARAVMGIYVGWPGALYPDELANSVTTFWNRLAAADRLGADDGVLRRLLPGLSQRLIGARAGVKAEPPQLSARRRPQHGRACCVQCDARRPLALRHVNSRQRSG